VEVEVVVLNQTMVEEGEEGDYHRMKVEVEVEPYPIYAF